MLVTADQLVAHAVGDYVLQSDWQALNKTKSFLAINAHAFTYTACFIFVAHSLWQFFFIYATHAVIDHWRLARYVVWAKNQLAPRAWRSAWRDCEATGYPSDRPAYLSVWLLIAADNIMHVLLNALAIRYL